MCCECEQILNPSPRFYFSQNFDSNSITAIPQENAMEQLIHDFRLASRLFRKTPSFTAIALLALALGVGANTVIFSAFNAMMLRPLSYTEPDRIVTIWSTYLQLGIKKYGVPYANAIDWQQRNHVFEKVALYQAATNTTFNLTTLSGPERIQSTRATGDFFEVMKVTPLLGRTIRNEDGEPGRDHVAVIGFNLWRRAFGGDPQIVGKTIKLNDEDYSVIGVMPGGFEFPSGPEMPPGQQFASTTELWVPLLIPQTAAAREDRSYFTYRVVARLKPGTSIQQAAVDMEAVTARMVEENINNLQGMGVSVATLRENQVGQLRPALMVLLAAVGFVLLIACANVANLLLSRAAVRQKEFAIRAALGASRSRIIQQLLAESVLLALIGGLLGLLLAAFAIHLLISLAPSNIPRLNEVTIDFRVLTFTVAVSLLTGILFGMAPALQSWRSDLHEGVKDGGRGGSAGAAQNRLRSALVVTEVTLVFVLLIAAGLMIRSFQRLLDVSPGIDTRNVMTARVTLPVRPYPSLRKVEFYRNLLDHLNHTSGVQAAGVIRDLPFSGTDPRYGFTIEGRPPDPNGGVVYRYRTASPDYFKAMGIPLKRGRFFTDHDDQDAPAVAIINETAAKQNWPDEDPIGQVILTPGGPSPARCTVIGIVGDVKFGGLDAESETEVYYSYRQIPEQSLPAAIGSMAVVVRTNLDRASAASELRRQVASIDKDVPVTSILTMDDLLSNSLAPRRFNLVLLAGFAAVALLLAAVGIYGVISYWVSQRTREIGIRMALGAQMSDIMKMVIREAMTVVSIGLGAGLVVSLGLTQFLSSTFSGLLFGVKASDPATFVFVGLVLATVALIACYIPARRAVKVEPTIALRYE